jgi:hypothetical protein
MLEHRGTSPNGSTPLLAGPARAHERKVELTYPWLADMLLCVRTTVDIQDDLLIELKRVAAERRRPLKELIEDAIRASLQQGKAARRRKERPSVITFRGRGVKSGVNLDSMQELLDVMDGTS